MLEQIHAIKMQLNFFGIADFLHVDTDSQKLKADQIVFG